MNPFEFVIAIVLIVTIGKVIQSKRAHRDRDVGGHSERHHAVGGGADPVETQRLRDEVKQLKERIHVLERIAVEKEDTLSRQIEELRDR